MTGVIETQEHGHVGRASTGSPDVGGRHADRALLPVSDRHTLPGPLTDRGVAARVAGVGYVLLFGLSVFANFFVREELVVEGDARATALNLADSQGLFRLGLLAFLAIFLIDIVVAWALHMVFRDTQRDLSLLTAWSRLVYTVFLGVGAIFLFAALEFYDTPGVVDGADHALVALELFNATWMIGLAAFGLHLLLLGRLIARSRDVPRLLGHLVFLAGAAYVVDTAAYSLLGNYEEYANALLLMVALPSVLAEGWLGLWLLVRGRRLASSGES